MPFIPFEELEVFRLSEKLADFVWKIANRWDPMAKSTVGKQLIRSVDSIGANIAEGCGRASHKDNKRFVKIARGSFNETKYWLRRAYTRKLLNENQSEELKTIVDELGPRLNAYLSSIGNQTKNQIQKTKHNP